MGVSFLFSGPFFLQGTQREVQQSREPQTSLVKLIASVLFLFLQYLTCCLSVGRRRILVRYRRVKYKVHDPTEKNFQ